MLTSEGWAAPAAEGFGRSQSSQQGWVQITYEHRTTVIFVQLELFMLENYFKTVTATDTNIWGLLFLVIIDFYTYFRDEADDATKSICNNQGFHMQSIC